MAHYRRPLTSSPRPPPSTSEVQATSAPFDPGPRTSELSQVALLVAGVNGPPLSIAPPVPPVFTAVLAWACLGVGANLAGTRGRFQSGSPYGPLRGLASSGFRTPRASPLPAIAAAPPPRISGRRLGGSTQQ